MRDFFIPCDPEPYVRWWNQQYGTPPTTLAGCSLWQRGKSNIWLAAEGVDPGPLAPVEGVGIPFLRTAREVWKPTAVAVMELGADATRNVVELDEGELRAFLVGGTIDFTGDDARLATMHRGFIIARYLGVPVGCGLWRRGALESAIPKGRRAPELSLPVRR